MKAGDLLGSIVDHCKKNGSEVLDARLFSTWIHGKVADTLSETAGELVSGFWQIAVIVLVCVGLVFAVPHFR